MGLSVWLDGDGKNALGELLMVPPPAVSLELAQQVAAQVYGWHAPVQPLSGERDRNFLVQVSPQTPATLKFINAAETRQETDVQVRVLEHLAVTGCAIPTPVAVASAQGLAAFEWPVSEGGCHRGRAYSFLRGVPMTEAAETPGLRRAVGQAAAQLAHSLADFAHPALEREFLWNVLHLGRLAPWAEALPADDVKAFVQRFMPHYEAQTLPRLHALPAQALHGDLSKSNLLVAPHDHEQVTGVLDFGDMVMAPRVVDLGIAASYLAEDTDTPMQALAEVVQGYEDIAPLRQEERDLVLDVVLARLVQRIVIPEWRARHFPENREYILRSNAQARRLLTQLMAHWRGGADMGNDKDALLARRTVLGPAYRLFYEEPLAPVRGEDVWLIDAQGRRYLDAYNNVPVVGHGNPRVVAAMATQAATLCTHTRYLHPAILDYAEQLLALFPPALDRAMFTCSGSEANDLALRIAQAVTGGTGVVVSSHAYHGVTQLLAQMSPSLAPIGPFVRTVPPPQAVPGQSPQATAQRFAQDVAQAFAQLQAAGIRPAALLIDTVFASDGLAPPVPGGFDGAFAAARAAGALVIADEVQAGFGRLGPSWWGFAAAHSEPDLVTMGKPMGNGYPVAAVVARHAWVDAFARRGRYFNTFGGNPVAMAVAQAVLAELQERGLPARAAQTGHWLQTAFAALAPLGVAAVRGTGLYWALQIAPQGPQSGGQRALQVVNYLRRNGILINTSGPAGDVLKIRPPLTFTQDHAAQLVAGLQAALQD